MDIIEKRKQLCARMKQIRNEQKISQTAMAEKLKTKQQAIAVIESGRHTPRLDRMLEILELFNYTVTVVPDFSNTKPTTPTAGFVRIRKPLPTTATMSRPKSIEEARLRICQRIAQLRQEAKMRQSELEKAAGVSVRYVTDIEAGRCSPTLDVLLALLQPFGYTIDFVPIVSL